MPRKKVEWTVMVYLAGDNNLSEQCVYGLSEMKRASCGDQINIVAQFDSGDDFVPTRRYEINRGGVGTPLANDIIDESYFDLNTQEVHFNAESKQANLLAAERAKDRVTKVQVAETAKRMGRAINIAPAPDRSRGGLDDADTSSPITLYNFLSFCIQEYPADHFMVVLSGHGAGMERDYFLKDEGSGGYLSFNELKLALEQVNLELQGQVIEIIGLDSCLMSMAEVCYELRGLGQIVVGCESYAPATGWPYRSILEKLNELVTDDLKSGQKAGLGNDQATRFAKSIVENYVSFYADYRAGGSSVTQSALDLTRYKTLKDKIMSLAETLTSELENESERENSKPKNHQKTYPLRDALILAHWEAQSYNGESYVDIVDFCNCLSSRYKDGNVSKVCNDLAKFITGQFVLRSCFNGSVYQYSNGVSMYFPWSTVAPYYLNFDLAKDSRWARFLATYTDLTRREPRRPPRSMRASARDLRNLVECNATISRADFEMASGELLSFRLGRDQTGSVLMGSGRISASKMASDKMASDKMGSDKMGSDKMGSDKMGSDKMGSDKMGSDKMGSDKMGSDKMGSDKMGSDKMGSGRLGSGRMGLGRMGSGKSGNPIHSMRNPPIVVIDVD